MKLPLKHIHITQNFGKPKASVAHFYKQLGLDGHNGIDFKCFIGCKLYAVEGGEVTFSGMDIQGGGCVIIMNYTTRIKWIYYHLSGFNVKKGDEVKEGQLIGLTGNSGKYTTGAHLHLGMKEIDSNGRTINYDNGYKGALDYSDMFKELIGNDWDKCNAYHRYGRKANWFVDWCFRFAPIDVTNQWTKSGRWVHKKRIKLGMHPSMSTQKVNAILYGGWDYETVNQDSRYFDWGFIKKEEYLRGIRAFK